MKYLILLLLISSCTKEDINMSERINNLNEWNSTSVETLNIIEDYRTSLNLNTLTPNSDLHLEAKKRAEYLQSIGIITHDGYSILKQNIEAKGYEYVSELLAYSYISPESAFNALLNSPSHKKAIEKNIFKFIGIHITEDSKYYVILLGN